MQYKGLLALAIGVALLGDSSLNGWAARKYYPPGFKPPTDQDLLPSSAPAEQPKTPIAVPAPQPGKQQVIIKTVPVTVEKTVTVMPKPKDPLMVLMEERRYFEALRMVDARLKKSPNNLTLQLTRGKILREQGNYTKAIEQYTAILEKTHSKTSRAEAQNGIGWTYYQKSLHDRQIGNSAVASASLRSADMAFRQAIRLNPDLPYVWAGLGEVSLANGQVNDAEVWIKKAKKLGPNVLAVQLAEADLLLAQHKPDEALQVLYGIKKTTTRDSEVYLLLARASIDAGKVDDAIINLKQLLELQPDHTEALKLLSLSYERKMKPEDAEVALEKAIALNPMDEKSVDALLKIYDQRREDDRSLLVLKTLLKDHPGQPSYALALLQRLADDGRWDEIYEEGTTIIPDTLSNQSENNTTLPEPMVVQHTLLQKEEVVALYARGVYQQGRSLLDRRPLLKEPAVNLAQGFAKVNLARESKVFGPFSSQSLKERLSLLLIDPLTALPAFPANFQPQGPDLSLAIQIAFLQGDHARHDQWLKQVKNTESSLALAKTLYELGDYQAANMLTGSFLAQHPDSDEARQLQKKIAEDQATLQENLSILAMLPRKIPDGYWRKTASEVLELGSTDGQAHGTLGLALEKRHQPELALMQLKMAAKYANTQEERNLWKRRADKTTRYLERNK